jgi:hypothetical protein
LHDSYVVVSLLKAIPIVLTVKILVISEVLKGLTPQASVWCGGECPHAYPVKSLGGGSYNLFWNYTRSRIPQTKHSIAIVDTI